MTPSKGKITEQSMYRGRLILKASKDGISIVTFKPRGRLTPVGFVCGKCVSVYTAPKRIIS